MVSSIKFSPIRRIGLWFVGLSVGIFFVGMSSVFAGTTPAISSATAESTGTVLTLLVEFNVPVWTDSALTTALATTDFTYTDTSAAGAGSITAIAHTAGDDFAVLTLNADVVAGDITVDSIRADANDIFTVGGALPEVDVLLADDDATLPAISSVTHLNGTPRLLVTFNKRVWSDDLGGGGAPPTTAPAVADFAIANGGSAEGCEAALAANLLTIAGARKVILDCGENAVSAETGDTIAAASGTSLFDAFGNDMGVGTIAFAEDTTAPTIISVQAVKDSTTALVRFSEPIFTDNAASGVNPAVFAGADFTYTDGATGGAASISSGTPGASSRFMLIGTGSGNHYATLTLNAAVAVNDLSGGASDDTLDAAASGTAIFDANGNGLATGGTLANRTLNDTIDPVILSATIDKTSATGQNTLALLYSEDVTFSSNAPTAGGAAIASTTSIGDATTACTIAGFGAFATGNLTYATLLNSVALDAAGTTLTITLAGQTGGYRTSTAAATACSGVLTPTANVQDLAPTANAIEVTAVQRTLTTTAAWDIANPLTAQVTTASSATTTTATIGWTAVTDAGTDFREYKFFYGTTTGSGASLAGTQWGVASDSALTTRTTTTTTLTSLNSGTIYFITPYVFDTFGNAATAAAEMNIQTNSSAVTDRTAPAAPTVVAIKSEGGKAVLTWTDPTATDLKDIVVLRGKNPFPVSGTPYALVIKGVKTYTDSDVMVGDLVKYILRGRDNANNESANSTEVSVTIVAAAPASTTPVTETPAVTPPAAPVVEPPAATPPPATVKKPVKKKIPKICKLKKNKNKKICKKYYKKIGRY